MTSIITIDVVSDVVCAWCFIGKRRMERAFDLVRPEYPGLQARLRWHPFFLNPGTPPEGEPYRAFMEHKFGGAAPVDDLQARMRAAGRTVGIEFAFEAMKVRPNTLDAHRLIHWAQAQGDDATKIDARTDALVEHLFAAHFLEGEHVGDRATLVRIAVACGYDPGEVESYLSSDRDVDAVRAAGQRAREIGVASVPTFIFGGHVAMTGAETPELFADALRRELSAA